VKRNFRLSQSAEFERVRRFGKSYAHPLVVLIVLRDTENNIHVGITAGRSVGNAVQRNKAKRMLREAIRPLLSKFEPGQKIVLIARNPILKANLAEISSALDRLITKANLINEKNGS
jgi:ribonuclease P protein component